MLTPIILYTTAALMALVATACTALCIVWSVPTWRQRLAPAVNNANVPSTGGLRGWPASIGSVLISAGIAACALLAWYGVYCVLAAV